VKIPTGQESARPFLPTRDFEVCRAFYESLGFNKLLEGDVAIFETGSTSFILQRRFEKTWAENCMMQLMVDDLDAWWKHIESLELAVSFGVPHPKGPCNAAVGLAGWLSGRSFRGPVAHRRTARWCSMGLVHLQP
jgi:hypothetical protein